jgi:hypothetical protein
MKNILFAYPFLILCLSVNAQSVQVKSNISFGQNIPMNFHNGSFFSIYLSIPGVMNPNLSPKSKSALSLDAGQIVYFFPNGKNGKKEILFTVSPTWKRDTILQIDAIIKQRKQILGY